MEAGSGLRFVADEADGLLAASPDSEDGGLGCCCGSVFVVVDAADEYVRGSTCSHRVCVGCMLAGYMIWLVWTS